MFSSFLEAWNHESTNCEKKTIIFFIRLLGSIVQWASDELLPHGQQSEKTIPAD